MRILGVIICGFLLADVTNSLVLLSTTDIVWTLTNSNGSINVAGTAPGGVYTDLMNGGILTNGDFYYRYNDLEYRWVSYENWTYSATFQATEELASTRRIVFEFAGLDTVAEVFLDGERILQTDNMFTRYLGDVTDLLDTSRSQTIDVVFQSPVEFSEKEYEKYYDDYGYYIFPECVDPAFQGECHANEIRKMQSSFSWDWGPAFPNLGIWKPWYIIGWSDFKITSVQFTATPDSTLPDKPNAQLQPGWSVVVGIYVDIGGTGIISGNFEAIIDGTPYITRFVNYNTFDNPTTDGLEYFELAFDVPEDTVNIWWPNGYGLQYLYTLEVIWTSSSEKQTYAVDVGFRTVELDQSFVDDSNETLGRNFFFKVNNVPMFMKGSNWIPAHVLPEQVTDEYIEELLTDAWDTNQNCLRVWGGGIYERDYFYYVADRLGIMIWQDMMFACSMYPANDDYLDTIDKEARSQIRRLQTHPSIIIWAGNNENEAALRDDWYGTESNFGQYKDDYVKLYVDTIRAAVLQIDSSRPFAVSSPSNGIASEDEGYIALNPYSNLYGDNHYYNYVANGWDWTHYPPTRFASEYGFQSWPSLSSMKDVTTEEDQFIQSQMLEHRQHHPRGQSELDNQLSMHFIYDPEVTSFSDYLYLCQLHQAMALKTETEYYRRMRSVLNDDGTGLTMGALYWQLNDIWQGASWSSIEFGGKWKMLLYYSAKFFDQVLISPWLDTDQKLQITVVSDFPDDIVASAVLSVELRSYASVVPLTTKYISTSVIKGFASENIASLDLDLDLNMTSLCDNLDESNPSDNCYVVVRLNYGDESGPEAAQANFLLLGEPKNAPIVPGNAYDGVTYSQVSDLEYSVSITNSKVVPFIWFESNLLGVWSDNGFIATETSYTMSFFLREESVSLTDFENSVTITSLNTLL